MFSERLLMGFMKPNKKGYKISVTISNTTIQYAFLPVKKDIRVLKDTRAVVFSSTMNTKRLRFIMYNDPNRTSLY